MVGPEVQAYEPFYGPRWASVRAAMLEWRRSIFSRTHNLGETIMRTGSRLLAAMFLLLASAAAPLTAEEPPRVLFLIGESEYETAETLPAFAKAELTGVARCEFLHASADDGNSFPGVEEALGRTDVLFVSVRRRTPPAAQLKAIRAFVESGKPVVGIRTASHAFVLRNGQAPPEGHADWPELDSDVFGGNYTGHHGTPKPEGPHVWVAVVGEHALTKNLPAARFESTGSLYQVSPLAEGSEVLLRAAIDGVEMDEPAAWLRTTRHGGRAFYTSLGHRGDFEAPAFRELLKRGILWAAGKDS